MSDEAPGGLDDEGVRDAAGGAEADGHTTHQQSMAQFTEWFRGAKARFIAEHGKPPPRIKIRVVGYFRGDLKAQAPEGWVPHDDSTH